MAQSCRESHREELDLVAGAENIASLRIAHKLGFVEVLRRTYVIIGP